MRLLPFTSSYEITVPTTERGGAGSLKSSHRIGVGADLAKNLCPYPFNEDLSIGSIGTTKSQIYLDGQYL